MGDRKAEGPISWYLFKVQPLVRVTEFFLKVFMIIRQAQLK